ncbi:MAG: hypothetical protein JO232_12035 [Verrucomicrobia bacterium]|nr:hypothetical protein [Verrucomicrobiota bacterium]
MRLAVLFAAIFPRIQRSGQFGGLTPPTTRMGETPKTGIVDKDCRVFYVAHLFVAGCSIFCSSGHANPTLTALAWAWRTD